MDIIREQSETSLAPDHSAAPTDGLSTVISHPSQVEEKPTARSEQNAEETHSTSEKEAGTNARDGRSALLNLPPPLPFDLAVANLWVGVPHRGPSSQVVTLLPRPLQLTDSWVPKAFRKKKEKEEGDQERKWILKGVETECHSGEVLAM
jgi:hypothetical protein